VRQAAICTSRPRNCLGWRDEQIIVVDNDQGESGASAVWREGFQRLVSDVGMGRAGIVMGLEVSRLARNNADWQRLLEICALADTLILDEDGVYDPTSFIDRLLLGLKGTMSEAELHVIKARLRGGILNKVRRGEYRCSLPTGLIYDQSGNVAFDPDSQIRETIVHFFDTFLRVGSACQTVKAFRTEGLLFPSRLRNSESTVFRPLTASTAIRVLNNPRYAGAYVYGRRRYRRAINGKKILQRRDQDDWLACIPNAHPGYISWEQFQQNLQILKTNGQGYEVARASPPREGKALLQGRAVCGRCGKHFRIRYAARRGRLNAWYVCDRAHGYRGEPNCQSIAGPPIDEAIGILIAEQMTPTDVELTIEIRREIEARYEEADRLCCRAIDRAQIEADLAQRRFMLVLRRRRDRHRQQPWRRQCSRRWLARLTIPTTPAEDLVRVHVVPTRHHRNRCPRFGRRRHNLALQRFRPALVPPLRVPCVHVCLCGHIPTRIDHQSTWQTRSCAEPPQGGAHRRRRPVGVPG